MNDKLKAIVEGIESKKGKDAVVLDLAGKNSVAEYFVICTGSSEPNLKAIVDEVEDKMEGLKETRLRIEGYNEGKWAILDYGDIMVHVFLEETRKFYNLENLWNQSEILYRG
ncbi:ribosome silencing factor [Haliovirga abyssi]|uniref:Ribosomal silencing factor RsfS n=1 Tax=Haliovirga abyssi TaxID=2996794 RepID=A0AAU9DUZ6_9FUSO|nr:ribosome silencing factor [Haliovirga abyssi]BDU49891.1 ribosomal silencing factor RsfS [Haliovirga abyssi]